ncbi:hypothetical protein ILYODFUR_024946 [Ilyodon furcidens]|uniref:CDT1 Geminin-binding domain-containing protein n=1 Tax=Ilyodon furcidens TaxID=33524 RepID=A0ABV0UYV2_9TELE
MRDEADRDLVPRCLVCSSSTSSTSSTMSQVRVTNFYGQKKGIQGAAKEAGKQHSGDVRGSSASEDYALCSSEVHEEFVQIINEAAGLINDGESVSTKPSKDLSSPRTPKRSSADAGLDLGAAAFSAKKRRKAGGIRKAEASTSEKTSRRTARKKLVLHDETPQILYPTEVRTLTGPLQSVKITSRRNLMVTLKDGSSTMSPVRVTNFGQKKGIQGAAKEAGKQHSGDVRGSSASEDYALCSSEVHEEFVQIINEAAGLINDGESVSTKPSKDLSSPRTPKRSSADAGLDLGAAAFSAKKRRKAGGIRKAEASTSEKTSRRTARKKLVLHDETPQALCKEDITALKSRLEKIKKQADIASPTSSAPPSTPPASSSPAASNNAALPVPTASGPSTTEARTPRFSVARAKELAAKAQRMKEEREAGEIKPAENPDSTKQPAYQRYHTLAQAVPPGLSLPYHYKILAEMFRSMDTVVAMLYNRSETATFAKVKQGVQDMMHKRFEESHVGQIKTVFPEAYTFKQEKNIPTFNRNISKGSYQLTLEPVLSSDQNEVRPVLSASRLLERRRIFHQNLISVVKQHHKTFLSLLVPPVSVPEDKLTRWHPRFNVDTVPAIQVGSLPQVPHTDKLWTAQEVLENARSLITPKLEKALVSLARNTEDKDGEAQTPSSLKGVPQSLLDRIRAKEAQKLQAAMTRNTAQEERLLMMSRLGELARILRNVFVAEAKAALIMEVACNRMVASYRSALSPGEMEKHIRLLAEVAPDWLSIHPVRKDFYLKLNKMVEVSIVLDKLSRRLKEEEGL